MLPDADLDSTTKIVTDSVYGCAGQRCLAASIVLTVGDHKPFTERLIESTQNRITGFGLDDGVEMGPVITSESKNRIEQLIAEGIAEGANPVVDGRKIGH